MRGQTIVRWGGQRGGEQLQIFNCHTLRFQQEAVFDESNTNLIGQKFTVEVIGYVHNDVSMASAVRVEPFIGGATATEQCVYLRTLAMKQRQRFEMEVGADTNGQNGSILLEADPFTGGDESQLTHKDINNGPRCLEFNVEHLMATVMRVSAVFEVMKAECSGFGANRTNNSNVLSNVWRIEDTVSQNFFTTRVWSGTLRLASSVGVNPNTYRSLVLPPLGFGMKREGMKFVGHESGLELSYVITDQEVQFAAPAPLTSWNFRHTESSGDGKQVFGEISVSGRSDRYGDRRQMLTILASIVEARLLTFENQVDADGVKFNNVIEMYSVTEEMGDEENDNAISINARVSRPFTAGALGGVLNANFGFPPQALRGISDRPLEMINWDPKNSRGNWKGIGGGLDGNSGLKEETEGPITVISAFSHYLQNPCSPNHALSDGQPASQSIPERSSKPRIEAYTTKVPAQFFKAKAHTSRTHRQARYTTFQGQSTYKTSQHTIGMPIAAFSDGSLSSSLLSSMAFVSLAPPTCERKYRVKATRMGQEPELPPGESFADQQTGIGFVFLGKDILAHNKDYASDGTPVYCVEVEYRWGMTRAPLNSEKLLLGVSPFDTGGLQRTSTASTNSTNLRQGPPVA